jgi:hypothetical protein
MKHVLTTILMIKSKFSALLEVGDWNSCFREASDEKDYQH